MASHAAFIRSAALAALCAMTGACDHGGAYVVDNRTDQDLIARVSGSQQVAGSSRLTSHPRQDVLLVPARSSLAVEILGFTDPFSVQRIEILSSDCALVGDFDQAAGMAFASDGQVIVVEAGPTATLRKEFPESGTLATPTDRCIDVASP